MNNMFNRESIDVFTWRDVVETLDRLLSYVYHDEKQTDPLMELVENVELAIQDINPDIYYDTRYEIIFVNTKRSHQCLLGEAHIYVSFMNEAFALYPVFTPTWEVK